MTLEVPGYRLHGRVADCPGREMYRAEEVGRPGHLLTVEHLLADASLQPVFEQTLERRRGCQHPHLLPVLDVVTTRTGVAVVSPTTPGGALADILGRAPGGLPAAAVAGLGARIAAALQALHDGGNVLGDIPLEDVRFDADGRPLLAGLLQRGDASRSDDLRALGAVLATALVGLPPATATDRARLLAEAPWHEPAHRSPQEDALSGLLAVIARAAAQDPADRLRSAADLADLLDRCTREDATRNDANPNDATRNDASPNGAETTASAGPPLLSDPLPAVPDIPATPLPGPPAPTGERAPAQPPLTAGHRPRRPTGWSLALVALLIATAATLLVWRPGGDEPAWTSAPTRASTSLLPDPPGPICAGMTPPRGAGDLLLPDLDGRGCVTPVRWDGRVLTVAAADAPPRYLLLDAAAEDQLLVADLGCEARDALVLYRPGTGEIFVLDRLAAPGEDVEVAAQPSGGVGGHATVHPGLDGCDRIVVVDPDRRSR